MTEVFLGRQPILRANLEVHGYELLFRASETRTFDGTPGGAATAQVLLNTLTTMGLESVVGDRLAFVNLTRGFVLGQYPLPVPPARVVLEILEDIDVDASVLQGLDRLIAEGFQIALDDFVDFDETLRPLLERADLVKVECLNRESQEIERVVRELKPFKVELLAEKIETREQFEHCRSLGFDYFQGYFFAKPDLVKGHAVGAGRMSLLRVVAELQDPACDLERIEEIVRQDVGLSYRILRCVNSVACGIPRAVDSLREAIMYLGTATVRSLVCLLLMSRFDDKPRELVRTAMVRGKMCELLAAGLEGKREPRHRFFTVGLLSVLDALMDVAMADVVHEMPLTEDLRLALLDHRGEMGNLLEVTIAFEKADWSALEALGLPPSQIQDAWFAAIEWTSRLERDLMRRA